MQGEIDARQKHENNGNQFDLRAVEVANAEIVSGKTTDGDSRESVAKRIEKIHSGQHVTRQA